RRRIDWSRLVRALDVTQPEDFADPDRCFIDQLPQPYRLIVHLLETEARNIRAGFTAESDHPELDTSPSDEARAAIDIDLKRSCLPGLWVHTPIADSGPPCKTPNINEDGDGDVGGEGNLDDSIPGAFQESVEDYATANSVGSNNKGTCLPGKIARDARIKGSIITAVQWDDAGEFLFTGSCDGSVSLRHTCGLEDILGFVKLPVNKSSQAVSCLSRAVKIIAGRSVHPGYIRIAAATTESIPLPEGHTARTSVDDIPSKSDPGDTEGDAGVEAEDGYEVIPTPSNKVWVLEVCLASAGTGRGGSGGSSGDNYLPDRHKLTPRALLRSVCYVELPKGETATELSLSGNGRRLAIAHSGGSVTTWILPPIAHEQTVEPYSGKGKRPERSAGVVNGDASESQSVDQKDADLSEPGSTGTTDHSNDSPAAAAAAAATAAAAVVQLGRPELLIPHLLSPAEREYQKNFAAYRRKVDAGEIEEIEEQESTEVDIGSNDTRISVRPRKPDKTMVAYHLARATILTSAQRIDTNRSKDGGPNAGGGTGGLAVWRFRSNVWKLYRLGDIMPWTQGKALMTGDSADVSDVAGGNNVEGAAATTGGNVSADGVYCGDVPVKPIVDITSVPSAEWVLPSPVTCSAVYDADGGGDKAGGWDNGADTSGCDAANLSIIAIGTENGGVYVCDGVLTASRKGLSKHRAKITALAFHRRRFLVSGSEDEMIHIHDISSSPPTHSSDDSSGNRRSLPALHCLHDARDSGIVQVVCLDQTPLTFAQDTSGRIVVYDLYTGTILGVLRLDNKTEDAVQCSRSTMSIHTGVLGVTETLGIPLVSGGDMLAVAPTAVTVKVSAPPGTRDIPASIPCLRGMLGIWSAADVIWGLCPGVREMADHKRPVHSANIVGLFIGLSPAERKGGEAGVATSTRVPRHGEEPVGATRAHPPPRFGVRSVNDGDQVNGIDHKPCTQQWQPGNRNPTSPFENSVKSIAPMVPRSARHHRHHGQSQVTSPPTAVHNTQWSGSGNHAYPQRASRQGKSKRPLLAADAAGSSSLTEGNIARALG
ncbi:unnamed protein product, partial [Sphacelaria rigidula]